MILPSFCIFLNLTNLPVVYKIMISYIMGHLTFGFFSFSLWANWTRSRVLHGHVKDKLKKRCDIFTHSIFSKFQLLSRNNVINNNNNTSIVGISRQRSTRHIDTCMGKEIWPENSFNNNNCMNKQTFICITKHFYTITLTNFIGKHKNQYIPLDNNALSKSVINKMELNILSSRQTSHNYELFLSSFIKTW